MIYKNIYELRKVLISELTNIDTNVAIKLPYEKDLLHQLIFEKGCICEDLKSVLKKIDLSDIDFSGIDVSQFDFTGLHGVKINPQTIYGKNLKFTKCNGVEFIGPFTGVKISNADFTGSIGARINPTEIEGSLEGCKFSGVTFIGPFKNVRVIGADFTGSIGARINPTEIEGSLEGCKFSGVEFIGPFKNVKINGADFTGSIGAVINLQKIYLKDISNTKLSGVILKGSFKDVDIEGADFTGVLGIKKLFKYEKGVKIEPIKVRDRNFSNTILNGVEFIGHFISIKISGANFTGSIGARINPNSIYNKDMRETIFKDVEFTEPFHRASIRGADFTGSKGAKIDPTLIDSFDLSYTVLNGVEFFETYKKLSPANFENSNIEGANFTGSKGVIINPQKICNKSLKGTICKDVIFEGSFDNVDVTNTDFTGSKGAKIDPRKTRLEELDLLGRDKFGLIGTICKDVELIAIPDEQIIVENVNLDGCIYGKEIIEDIIMDICEKYKTGYNNSPRKQIIKELRKYRGSDKIKLPDNRRFLRLILFDGENFAKEIEEEILMKIDYSNVDFSGFNASGVDFSKYTGVILNLDTIKDKDISNSNLNGVTIIGSFDGIEKTNARLENASFEENSFEDEFREKIKCLIQKK